MLSIPKIMAGSLAPLLGLLGGLGALGSLLAGVLERRMAAERSVPAAQGSVAVVPNSRLMVLAGVVGASLSARYVRRATPPHTGFEQAFGPDWRQAILRQHVLPRCRIYSALLPIASISRRAVGVA